MSERLALPDPGRLRQGRPTRSHGRALRMRADAGRRHHPGHRRLGGWGVDAVPDGQAVRRRGAWSGSSCCSTWLDGAMARERGGGTRFGAVLDATCDRISDGAVFCGLLWWIAFGMHNMPLVVATLDLSGHLAGDLVHQGPGRSQWAARRRRPDRTAGTADHRAGSAGVSDFPFIPWPPALPVGDVDAGGGQPDHLGAAVAHGACLARRHRLAFRACRERASRDTTCWLKMPGTPSLRS